MLTLKTFTPRHQEIMALLADGKSNTEIGKDLAISVHTVKAYVQQIADRLEDGGLGRLNRKAIARWYLDAKGGSNAR